MNIINCGHSNLERLLLLRPQKTRVMATSLEQTKEDPEDPAYYAYIKKSGETEPEKEKFEVRFNFKDASHLPPPPPPIPDRSPNVTSPPILGRSSSRFLRPVHSSPKTGTLGRCQGVDETSFESDTTTDGNNCISSVGRDYNYCLLLHDTLK